MKNGFGKLMVFGLSLALGLSLLAGCAAPAGTAPQSPAPAAPATATPAPAVPTPVASAPVTPTPAAPPAVAPAPVASFPMEITDQLGRVVTIKKAPQRIISIAPSDTEIIFALGLGDMVVGVDQYSDYPAEAKTKTNLGGYTNPSIEKIVALNPDLILVTRVHEAKVIPVLESMHYPVLGLDPKTVDEVLTAINLVGKITGKNREAADLTASLQKRIGAVTDKTNKLNESQRPKTFYIVWPDPLMSSGNGTFQADLIQKAGGTNIAQNLEGWKTISLEAVITANPEVMIAGSMANANTNLQFIKTEPRLANTDARRLGKVYEVDGNLISRPGPRLVDALEEFARTLHPELFK
ncbi:MAG: cobalamin-binding protein [Chloroflexi bacterium]|nr:cobalamin-binding protein [Chloroflexota bacterium]